MSNKCSRRAYGLYDQVWGGGYIDKREGGSLTVINLFGSKGSSCRQGCNKVVFGGLCCSKIQKFDERRWNAREHVVHFVDSMGVHANDADPCIREVSNHWHIGLTVGLWIKVRINARLGASCLSSQHKILCIEAKFTLIELGQMCRYPRMNLDAYLKKFHEKALAVARCLSWHLL